MRTKRIVSVILSIMIVCSSFAGLTAFADETNKSERTKEVVSVGAEVSVDDVSATSGTTGDCTWSFDEGTKTLTITGNGKMEDYYCLEDIPWDDFRKSIKNIVIGNGVTSIGELAFSDCTGLNDVTIGDNVTSIGNEAFSNCTGLNDVTIGGNVTSIGREAFSKCTGLNDVTIGDNVTSIGNSAFYNCTGLSSVKIGDGVTSIGDCAFYSCTSLSNITIGESVTSIGYEAFYGCEHLTDIYITDITKWCKIKFDDTSNPLSISGKANLYIDDEFVSELTIPNSVTSIGNYAFYNCKGLSSVKIGDGVTSIGDYAFCSCTSLSNITIGESVTSIGKCAFYSCTSLTELEIPFSVKSIEYSAFDSCTGLTSVKIGDNVTDIGYGAFVNCTSLTSVTIPDSVTSIGFAAFDGSEHLTIYGYTGTFAEQYANDNEFNFVSLGTPKTAQNITNYKTRYEITVETKTIEIKATAKTQLSYRSDNPSVAEVSDDGVVTIKGAGFAKITITAQESKEYKSATAITKITVNKISQDITGLNSKYEVKVGAEPFKLNAKAKTSLSYVSDNTSVAEVSADGTVTIKGLGTATITITAAETADYNPATATAEITVGKSSQNITGFESRYNLKCGDKPFSLNAKAETSLSYVSDNTSVAEVSADGTVTIKGAGTATITITAAETEKYNSATATVKITVAKISQKVTGVKSQYVTKAGKSFTLKPKTKTKLTYTSSNKNVAVVSSNGKVTVKGGGCAYITVKASENGNYKSAYVKTKIISAPKDFTSKDVSKVKKTGKTKAKITWKTLAGAKGYTVQLATKKSYKGAKTVKNSKNTATLTGLKKGKTYYVRINAYTKVSGKNYSNKWYTVKFKM